MFEVRSDRFNTIVFKSEFFSVARDRADKNKLVTGDNYTVLEVKEVYVTSTLDEALRVESIPGGEPNRFKVVRNVGGGTTVVKA